MIQVLVEIPKGSRNKYEFDERTGAFRLDRVLYSSVHYPTDYGFIPETRAEDGDHLDVLLIVNEPTFSGCLVPARPVGVLRMRDEKGIDCKILAVPLGDPRFAEVHDLDDIPPHLLTEIENFFNIYKTLEGKETRTDGWDNAERALQVIADAVMRFQSECSGGENG
ncbi:MAG: inorganic diphosphatase [Chloroflexia bacterium]